MKKPKFEHFTPTQKRVGRLANFMYFFATWNLLVVTAYYVIKRKKLETDPNWDKLNSSKYISV